MASECLAEAGRKLVEGGVPARRCACPAPRPPRGHEVELHGLVELHGFKPSSAAPPTPPRPLLIENIEEELDPVLDPVLERRYIRKGGRAVNGVAAGCTMQHAPACFPGRCSSHTCSAWLNVYCRV